MLALMFAFHFPPSLATGARRPGRFAKYLERHGYKTHAITCEDREARAVGWSRAASALQRVLPYNDQLPWVAHAVEAAEKVIRECRPDVLVSTSPPVACHLAAWLVARRHAIPWVADFRDPIYGNPSRNRMWGWVWDAPVDRLIVSRADAIVANTDAAAAMLARRYPGCCRKLHLIWNGYDPEQALEPLPIPQREYKLLTHAGSIYGQRHPTLLLASLDRLISRGAVDPAGFRVRLVGDFVAAEPWVTQSKLAELTRLGCIEHTGGMVSAERAAREIAEADYLLLLDLNDRGAGLQVPAKIFEYIQVGRPILAFTARNSAVERILASSGAPHVLVHPDRAPDIVDRQVLDLLSMPSDPVRPSAWFREQFDGAAQTRTLARILDTVRGVRKAA